MDEVEGSEKETEEEKTPEEIIEETEGEEDNSSKPEALTKTKELIEKLETINKKFEENIKKMEKIGAEELLKGRSVIPRKPKELDPIEYSNALLNGEVENPLKPED